MSYEVHITRKDDWADQDGSTITREDWMSYLSIDKTLRLDMDHAAQVDPRVASGAKEPTHARWIDWPGREAGEAGAWMWLENGNIVASDADDAMRRKMFLIADGLGARLMGDDGEVYNSLGQAERTAKRPWWKFW